jgi:hypothetical protein
MKTLDASDIVFVYGALRSGTTVFRLMLDAHPQIANPGEMDFLFDYLHPDPNHPTGWRYNLDGLRLDRIYQVHSMAIPDGVDGLDLLWVFLNDLRNHHPEQVLSINIHRHVNRIIATLPNARLIHMLRDPRDVARSSIVMGWAGTTYHAVDHWIKTEAAWDAGLAGKTPPPLMTFQYETLFADTEGTLKKVCAFLDLAYDPQIMSYHEGTTYAAPDPKLVQQWRKKANPHDMALLEHRAGRLMQARGYPPEMPPVTPSVLDQVQLYWRNKTAIWRFGVKRHGLVTYASEKLTRWLGLRPLHRRVRQRMNQTETKLVK